MSKVSTIPVTSTGSPEPIQATVPCYKITVMEDPSVSNWPTTAFNVYSPTIADGPIQRSAGQPFVFRPHKWLQIRPGDIIGYVSTVNGSTSFQQVED